MLNIREANMTAGTLVLYIPSFRTALATTHGALQFRYSFERLDAETDKILKLREAKSPSRDGKFAECVEESNGSLS